MLRRKMTWLLVLVCVAACLPAVAVNYTDWTQPFDPDANTVLLLHFDDGLTATTANDSAPNPVNGVLNTGLANQANHYVASDKPGFGNTVQLNYEGGITKSVLMGTDTKFGVGSGDTTIECWIKPNSVNSYWNLAKVSSGGDYYWYTRFISVTAGMRMGFGWYSNGGWQGVEDNVTEWKWTGMLSGVEDVWSHIAVTVQRRSDTGGVNNVKFWKNGVMIYDSGDVTAMGIPSPQYGPLEIAGSSVNPDYSFLGKMDELRISNVLRYGAPVGAVSVQVTLVDFPNDAGLLAKTPVKIVLAGPSATTKIINLTSNPGSHTISNLEPGTYTVTVSAARFVQQVANDVSVSIGNTTNVSISLPNGDVNGDNLVNDTDVGVVTGNIDEKGD